MKTTTINKLITGAGLILASLSALAQEKRFSEQVGPGEVGPMPATATVQMPYITWGGDMATFYANGGLTTKAGSLFQRQGLNLKLTAGDDFLQQVRDYRAGKSPFLRGTFHMIGLASEVIGSDPRTKGVVILQLTWSAGDHMVAREQIKTLNDLKGKTIVLQQGGPHVGMLDDVLKFARLSWDDIKVVWAKDLTGSADSPPEIFRKRKDVDACFAITPDMMGLCSGLKSVGTGAETTVKGARVLISTANSLAYSIADVYVCRKDFYDAHKDWVTKFVAGYLKGVEEVSDLKKDYDQKKAVPAYKNLLQLTQDIYGKTTIPGLDDAHGLISDCSFVGYPGNVEFFTAKGTGRGFEELHKAALDLAVGHGYAKERFGLLPPDLDYKAALFTSYLKRLQSSEAETFVKLDDLKPENELVSFSIYFEPNQDTFTAEQYGKDFSDVVANAAKGHVVFLIRGHADPTKTLSDLVKAGMQKGVLKRAQGPDGKNVYSLEGQPFDLAASEKMGKMIEAGVFDGVPQFNPRATMQNALNLSQTRAEAVRDSIVAYAKSKGLLLKTNQLAPVGIGIREPFIAVPRSPEDAKKNMRVEFRIMSVPAESITPDY